MIRPTDLEYSDGSRPTGTIDIQILELTNCDELLRAHAATISQGRLLSSGGSYFIGIESNGRPLRIRRGHQLTVLFPVLKSGEMELFYGQRDANNNMNWTPAGTTLPSGPEREPTQEEIGFTDSFENDNILLDFQEGEFAPHAFKSMQDEVYYYDKPMTVEKLVSILNARETRLVVDTVYNWPGNLPTGQRLDSNHLRRVYGPMYTYWLISASAKKRKEEKLARMKELKWQAEENWKKNSLIGQVQRYYAPALIGRLGWINCDRFYNKPSAPDVELEIPITFSNHKLNYFILFPSINGMLNNNLLITSGQVPCLTQLPFAEPVTFVGFLKKDSLVYRCHTQFIPGRDKRVQLDFSVVSRSELIGIFGRNIRI